MKFLSLFSGCGGFDLGLEKAGMECVGQIEIMPYALKVLKKHWPKVPKHTDILTFCASGSLVKIYPSRTDKQKEFLKAGVDYSSKQCESQTFLFLNGYSSRMFPDSFRLTEGGTLRLSCKGFPKAGMGTRGEFWTVNTSESPNDAVACSLSDILETNVPLKFYLSRKAVAGILRRTEKWSRSGYVFLQEMERSKTRGVKILSLQSLKALITTTSPLDNLGMKIISCVIPSEATRETKEARLNFPMRTSLPTPSGQNKEELLGGYGSKVILRKLTPTEKERLQGFPIDFTKIEE